jgi:hypothetical protein
MLEVMSATRYILVLAVFGVRQYKKWHAKKGQK